MAPVRLAIIGGGLIGSRHGRLMAGEDQCELVAVGRSGGGGEIGDLLAVSATWAVAKPAAYFDAEWRRAAA